MKRRKFLQLGSLASAPFLLNGFPVSASANLGSAVMGMMAQGAVSNGNVLVIIQLNGGNDALNTYFPLDKWTNLQNARSNILMAKSSVLPLADNDVMGFHPAMGGLKTMYDNGQVLIVQGVSYPNPNFSHFRATDIWFSGSGSSTTLETGWLGRSLDDDYPDYPNGYPNSTMEDPLAIQIGSSLPFSLQGPNINMGYNVSDPNTLQNVINGVTDPAPNNDYGRELTFLRLMKDQSNAYRTNIQTAYNAKMNSTVTYPSSNSLADALKIVAKLINGGLTTPIYVVNHSNSFDSHTAQVNTSDFTTGSQATNLTMLSQAIVAFQTDMNNIGKANQVTGMTHSEFGRRIISNASYGTDHGSAAPVMFFGAALNTAAKSVNGATITKRGMIGASPNLPLNATVNDQVPMQYDFRQLYQTVMEDWFGMASTDASGVLTTAFAKLPIFNGSSVLPEEGIELVGQYVGNESKLTFTVANNPVFTSFVVEFGTDGTTFNDIDHITNLSLNDAQTYYTSYQIGNVEKLYYRIRGVQRDGDVQFSNILYLRANMQKQLVSIYPNPVKNSQVHVDFFQQPKGDVEINLFTATGDKLYYNKFSMVGRTLTFSVPQVTANAHYYLQVLFDGENISEELIFLH